MKSALSLKLGGWIIEAEDSDYSSCKKQALVCQYCHEPVFYIAKRTVGETKRKLKNGTKTLVSGYETDPYFAHFDKKNNYICKADDSHKYSSTKTFIKKGKEQRKEFLKQKINDILKLNPRLNNGNLLASLYERSFQLHNKQNLDSYLRINTSRIRKYTGRIKSYFQQVIEKIANDSYFIPGVRHQLDYLKDPVEATIHQKIGLEVVEYLLSNSGYETMALLYKICHLEAVYMVWHREQVRRKISSLEQQDLSISVAEAVIIQQGLLGLSQNSLISALDLEVFLNELVVKEVDFEIIIRNLSTAVALTPWKAGFELSLDDLKKQLKADFDGIYLQSYHQKIGSYLIIKSSNKLPVAVKERNINEVVDFDLWFNKITSNFSGINNRQLKLEAPLPSIFKNIKAVIDIPDFSYKNKIAKIQITNSFIIHGELIFWQEINCKKAIKKFIKTYQFDDKNIYEKLFSSPSGMVTMADTSNTKHLLMIVLNCILNKFPPQ